jgi:CRP/FNR family transcriptional regulator
MAWTSRAGLNGLPTELRAGLDSLPVMHVPKGKTLFRPGDTATGFSVVLAGRIEVFLTGPTGREILLYGVEPGESCVQTTLGLMGGEDYTGEAITASDCDLVMIPRTLFLNLMDRAAPFRSFVFRAFAARMQGMMQLLERVAFQRVESRLAAVLLDLAQNDEVHATQAELAARIGTAREVISRRLDSFARRGWVETDRGRVRLTNPLALRRLAETDAAD